jgi:DNA-binding transcriptional LysR family regulator
VTLNLRQLRYFVVVAEELHFTRAAARLQISQPPLSQQIRGLEHALGCTLFRRTSKSVQLTPEGLLLLERARPLLAEIEDVEVLMRRAGQGQVGVVRIGYVGSAAYDTLPAVVRAFRRRHPDVVLQLDEQGTGPQIEALLADRLDVGFVRPPLNEAILTFVPLTQEPLLAVLPATHRLAARESVAVASLSEEPFIIHQRRLGAGLYDEITSLCRLAGFSPRIVQETGDMQTVLSLVSAGMGVGMVPASMASIRRASVEYRPISDSAVRLELGLARRADSTSAVVRQFCVVAARVARGLPNSAELGRD